MENWNWLYGPSVTTSSSTVVNANTGTGCISADQIRAALCWAPGVKKVIYNYPATVVIWNDGVKTVVRCHPEDEFDRERGFLMCCAKRLFGNGGKFNDVLREHCWGAE